MRSSLAVVIAAIALVVCTACAQSAAQYDAQRVAAEYVSALSVPSEANERVWRLRGFHVFGRDSWFQTGIGAGASQSKLISRDPWLFEHKTPLWVEGISDTGATVKLRRTLVLKVGQDGATGQWRVREHTFTEEQPLRFSDQVVNWLLWSFVLPVFMFFYVWSNSSSLGCARIAIGVGGLPLVGYIAAINFGVWWAALICIPVYLVICLIMLGVLGAVAASGTRRASGWR
jgi:hypothetical protein